MRRAWFWNQEHNDVVQKLLRKARKGTRVIYIPGNHDENFRDFAGHRFGRVAVLPETIHISSDGRRFLVLHAGKKIKGRKRHILTDTSGLLVGAVVHAADIQDRDGAPSLLSSIRSAFPWLRHVFADGGYAGDRANNFALSANVWFNVLRRRLGFPFW